MQMIHFYLKPIILITILFFMMSMAVRALGATQPPNPALRGFTEGCEGKPQPCWYGIVLGATTIEETSEVLQSYAFVPANHNNIFTAEGACTIQIFLDNKQELTQTIQFSSCDKSMMWGDFFTQVGLPRYKYDTDGGRRGIASDYWNAVFAIQPTNILLQPVSSFQLSASRQPCLDFREFAPTWRLDDLEYPYC